MPTRHSTPTTTDVDDTRDCALDVLHSLEAGDDVEIHYTSVYSHTEKILTGTVTTVTTDASRDADDTITVYVEPDCGHGLREEQYRDQTHPPRRLTGVCSDGVDKTLLETRTGEKWDRLSLTLSPELQLK
jgi:hypothetical protein